MAGRRASGPPSDLTPVLLLAGAAATGAAAYFGVAPVVVAWAAVLTAAWAAVPPVLTGKKDSYGYPQPANPAEKRKSATFRFWRELRWRLVIPGADWLPGWPVLASWAAAVVVGAICWLWPVRALPHYHVQMGLERAVDALAGAWLVASMTAAKRQVDDQAGGAGRPATRFDAKLAETFRKNPVAFSVSGGTGAMVGALAGIAAQRGLDFYHHWAATWAVHHPHHVPPPGWGVVVPHTSLLVPLFAVGGALAAIGYAWHEETTGHWRHVSASADEWALRWAALKADPAPSLVDRRDLGPVTVYTFDAPPNLGAMWAWPLAKKLAPTLGAGFMVAVLEQPDNVPGTRHPVRFDVAVWSDLPDFTSPDLTPEVAVLAAHSCFAWATEAAGYGRPVPLTVERISAEGAASTWASRWAWPAGPSLVEIKAITDNIAQAFRCEVLIDHRGDAVFFGAFEEGTLAPDLERHVANLRDERAWEKRWGQIAVAKDHTPVYRAETTATAELADGTEVHCQAFTVRQGIDPAEFRGLEPKLATTLRAAPFVAVCGWPDASGRPGDRHSGAVVVYWSESPVPTSLERLGRGNEDEDDDEDEEDLPAMARRARARGRGPAVASEGRAEQWVLAGLVNKAFDAARLSRPELAGAVELSAPGQRSHLWAVRLRLYNGVVVADVRAQAGRLQQALQVSWLRVAATDEPDLAVLYAGAVPAGLELEGGDQARLLLTALDWEQAWLDSKVVGATGEPPKLADLSHMPHNADVSVLDFLLPPGVDRATVRAAKGKLKAATGNAYVEDADSPLGADAVRLLVSTEVPLPKLARLDWGAVESSGPLSVPVGTGTDGEPVSFDLAESPHLLVTGATGSGKSSLLQVLVYGWLVKGAGVVVIDPVKGGADFAFAEGYVRTAKDLGSSVAAVRAVYAEATRRKKANAAAGVSSWLDMDDPPPPLVVLIDEFTSVLIASQVPKRTGDPELDAELDALEAENHSRTEIGILVSKLAREARSAGVVVILAAQKLAADTLEKIPGKDLKTNLGRVLIGQASDGERLSALRAPRDAPALPGEIPPGRGLFETVRRTAVLTQFWYAAQGELKQHLYEKVAPGRLLDLAETGDSERGSEEMVDIGVLDLSLEDLEPSEDGAAAPALARQAQEEKEEIGPSGPEEAVEPAGGADEGTWAVDEDTPVIGEDGPSRQLPDADELFPDPEPLVSPYDDPFG